MGGVWRRSGGRRRSSRTGARSLPARRSVPSRFCTMRASSRFVADVVHRLGDHSRRVGAAGGRRNWRRPSCRRTTCRAVATARPTTSTSTPRPGRETDRPPQVTRANVVSRDLTRAAADRRPMQLAALIWRWSGLSPGSSERLTDRLSGGQVGRWSGCSPRRYRAGVCADLHGGQHSDVIGQARSLRDGRGEP